MMDCPKHSCSPKSAMAAISRMRVAFIVVCRSLWNRSFAFKVLGGVHSNWNTARGMSGWQFRNPECLSDPHLVAALASTLLA